MEVAANIAAEDAMASVMGLHGVPKLAAAFRGSTRTVPGRLCRACGSLWGGSDFPRNAVDIAVAPRVEVRGAVAVLRHKRDLLYTIRRGREGEGGSRGKGMGTGEWGPC